MVQEKDADKRRLEARKNFLNGERERLEKNTVKFSWHVVEHTPGYNTGGYYGMNVPAEDVKVSPSFDKKEDAWEWMEAHEPDKGKTLHLQRMRLIRRVYEDWVTY